MSDVGGASGAGGPGGPEPGWARLWDVLTDLEHHAEALYDAERGLDLLDRAQSEYAQVTLAGRLLASVGTEVAVDVLGLGWLAGRLERAAAGWLHLTRADRDWVVPYAAVRAVGGASPRAVPEVAWSPLARLGWASFLRRLSAARTPCALFRSDGGRLDGVLTRIGADFVELRSRETVLVPTSAIVAVASSEA